MPFVNNLPMGKGYTKSNYKLQCHVCNETIYKGDDITRCEENGGHYSMTLRVRYTSDGSFYSPETGQRLVHKNCIPNCWTTYSMTLKADEDNREMNPKINYITNKLGLKSYSSNTIGTWSIYDVITEAYVVLGKRVPFGLTNIEHIDFIRTLIDY